jgi:hypothetical protein
MADAEERVESEGFYEMLWDCPHCDTKGLLGKSQRHCANCGAPQDPSTRYFPTPEQQKEVAGHIYEGADRTCPSCNAPHGARANNCTQCGAPMDGSGAEVREVVDAPAAASAAPAHARRIWPFVVGGLVVIAAAIWFLFIRTKSADIAITGHHWTRTIAIEEYGDQRREAWRDQVPAAASFPTCYRKQRTTRQIPDGEDCHTERKDKKDGTFEQVKKCSPRTRSEGVDDDWCTFTVRAWAQVSEAKATGIGITPAPAWPTTPVPATAFEALGARRAGARTEKLTLEFGPDDSCDVSDAVWHKYSDGQKAHVEVRARSGGVVCGSL